MNAGFLLSSYHMQGPGTMRRPSPFPDPTSEAAKSGFSSLCYVLYHFYWCKSAFAVLGSVSSLLCWLTVWPSGVMVKALVCDSRGREFNSWPFRCQVTTLGKLFTHMCLCHQAV